MECNKRNLKLDNTEFQKQPCFDAIGLAIAISFVGGYAEIPLNRIINALAAANALEMWDMRKAIIEQLRILASKPESAPFAINVAVCNLEKDKAKYVVKQSLDKFDEIIKQNSFVAINNSSFEFFISLFIYEHSTTESQVAIELAVQAIKVWCGNDDQRYTFAKNILNKLRLFCNFDFIDQIERLIDQNLTIHSLRDKVEIANDTATQHNTLKITSKTTGDPITDSDEPLKFEKFRQIELPAVKPDANGIRHYSFTIEFEAPKELLLSNKPKLIGLQLEAILECSNQ
ncbi:unnamed protein product [Wuchereria bancrofti]|uniref:Uncharacterized protein n=1 Tax=Wuchereria bancrofti TaxID=6293 RepID=A0A3P7DX70_WUCBA|nr:unnamed protein product [Wuchereria bancrofti]